MTRFIRSTCCGAGPFAEESGRKFASKLAFASAVTKRFMIVKNDGVDPVVGTFKGLPQGATTNFNGAQFQISYFGGTGNDLVLTQLALPAPPQLGGIIQLGNGQIQLSGTGVPGLSYTVQDNTNLMTTNWVNIGVTMAQPPASAFQFIDMDAVSEIFARNTFWKMLPS